MPDSSATLDDTILSELRKIDTPTITNVVATYPKNEVAMVNGHPRVFVTWDGCQARPTDVVCEEPQIKLRFSDDLGETWSSTRIVSKSGLPGIPFTSRVVIPYCSVAYATASTFVSSANGLRLSYVSHAWW